MKQYIFRHEKALSKIFAVSHILLKSFYLLLVFAVATCGIHYAMMHYTFPVTSEKASCYITLFVQNWLSLAFVIFAFKIWLRYICYGNTVAEILKEYIVKTLKKSVLFGLAVQAFIYCFYFCCLSDMTLVNLCFCFLPISIILEGCRKLFKKVINRAKHEQRLKCLQCLEKIAARQHAVIER